MAVGREPGNLYIADVNNNRIRKVDTAGVITTVAGNGTEGYSGDGGAAVAAQLFSPWGVAVDGAGNLYIADVNNNRIRKVDTAGVITTVAGNGTEGYSGDGGAAVAAQLFSPVSVAVDGAGDLYIAEWNSHRIRKGGLCGDDHHGGGKRDERLQRGRRRGRGGATEPPHSLWRRTGPGNLYIADRSNHRIRKVDTAGVITTVAGNGTRGYNGDDGAAVAAQLNSPSGVALDGAGNLYIADWSNNRIRRVCRRQLKRSDAPLLYAGAAPCCAGLYQFAVRLPDGPARRQRARHRRRAGRLDPVGAVPGDSTPISSIRSIKSRHFTQGQRAS